ncbi:hypothetical protein BB561_000944 [Smittium simulii]|uniref:Uncharacterized protein n=1 Tax=Smittium simulii TaxID=133385 RepID=A0A2T9YWY9_9FUNG|nr:hypothetical protein BB561_000944 [Smittium simulii]
MLKAQNSAPVHISAGSCASIKNGTIKSWEELQTIIESGRFELLGRTQKEQARYMSESAKLAEQHGSVSKYMTAKLSTLQPRSGFILMLNDYPYALEESISHYILWSTSPLPSGNTPPQSVIDYLDSPEFCSNIYSNRPFEFLWLVNPPHLRSVPSIYHGHLFIKQ